MGSNVERPKIGAMHLHYPTITFMYDTRQKPSGSPRSDRGKAGTAASAGWILVLLTVSLLVAWAELREDPRTGSVIPEESACFHPSFCVG